MPAYLNTLGLDREAIEFFVAAPPESIEILTPARAQALNIPFVLSMADGGTRLVAQASPRHFARVSARYIAISASCTPLFEADPAFYRVQSELALQQVHAIIGPEAGFDMLSQEVRGLRADRDTAGLLDWCIGAVLNLANASLPLGIEGPSFPCSQASTAPEIAICGEPRLWVFDRALSSSYAALRLILDEHARQALLEGQRSWLRRREACETDTACLEALYQSRLRDMLLE